jgi:hypothetical protein
MTKVNLILAGAAMVFAVGCLTLFRDLRTERSRAHSLEAQVAQLQREAIRPQSATSNDETAPATEPPAPTVAAQTVAAPATPTASKPDPTQESAAPGLYRRILADPAYRATAHAARRGELQSEHPHLASELGLSKKELDGFLDLLAEQALQEHESNASFQAGEDFQARRKVLDERQENERRQLLGEQRSKAWTEYVQGAETRELVGQLRTQLATSTSPLSEDQVKPLVKALAAEHRRHWAERQQNHADAAWTDATPVAERVAYMERRAELVEQWVVRAQEVAAMYLDSTQQRVLDKMLERQNERARTEVVTMQAFWEAEARQLR